MNLSVVLLAYNEEKSIEHDINSIKKNILDKIKKSELIIIEDFSLDKTFNIIKKNLNKKIKVFRGKKNLGYRKSLELGLKKSRYKNIFFCETGKKYNFKEFNNFKKNFKKKLIFSAYRCPRNDSLNRRILTYLMNLFIRYLFSIKLMDIDSGYKLFDRDLYYKFYCKLGQFSDFGSAEAIIRLYFAGYKIVEKKITYYQRSDYSKQFNLKKIIIKSIKLIFMLIKLKKELQVKA
jgi:glycosyltransferase involved in cell wall biosynthesis